MAIGHTDKDIILFVNSMYASTSEALKRYEQTTGRHFTPVVIVDKHIYQTVFALNGQAHLSGFAEIVVADFDSPISLRKALRPYEHRLAAITSQYENSMTEFKKIIPYVPYLQTPTETSLQWSTDKQLMRQALDAYDSTLSPASMQIEDASNSTIAAIEARMPYPVIIKPCGLERSLLVSVVHDRHELIEQLHTTFNGLQEAYRQLLKRLKPAVLVEEFMQGDMYSIDTYVAADGVCRHAPAVKVITGRKMGFTDFFEYLKITPAGLSDDQVTAAQYTAEQACHALGLRSVTAHVEMMLTPNGWRLIEIGPRIGGWRDKMYERSYGMNHIVNDLLNRMGLVSEISNKPLQYMAIFDTYPRVEGTLDSIQGIEAVKKLPSFKSLKCRYNTGDMIRFASNNGDAPVEVELSHDTEAQLYADIHAVEQLIDIKVSIAQLAIVQTA